MPKNLEYSIYDRSRFQDVPEELAKNVWLFAAMTENLERIKAACEAQKAAALCLEIDLLDRFEDSATDAGLTRERLAQLCLNMTKQILEHLGYHHVACTLIPGGRLFTSAGVFAK